MAEAAPADPVPTPEATYALRMASERAVRFVRLRFVDVIGTLKSISEPPESTSWTRHARSTLVRVPSARPADADDARIELRAPDSGCNPYLALATVIAAGLRGVERGYLLGPPDEEHPAQPPLPEDLREAMGASELIRETLGDRLVDALLRNKRGQLAAERARVTRHERATLLRLL